MKRCILSGVIAAILLFGAVHFALAKEYKILAIRVDFPYEEPDHDTTSGRGTFDLRDYYSDEDVKKQYLHPWDVPPHDSPYFAHHLTALGNYWRTVSEGRITISYDIWPGNAREAYTMSKKFYKYGNGRSEEQTSQKLVELFDEAVTKCKEQEGSRIDFSDYDTFMIIRAGIGQETTGGLNDIPSAFLSIEDFIEFLEKPIKIDGKELDNGLIIPEMASSNGVGGLNGIITQMFSHRLGLPSMSNNEIGLPGAGGWSLMDTGAMSWGNRTRGFVPTHPCIWSKIELGWIEPVIVTSDTTIDIAATHLSTDLPKAVKIPISGNEYLLLENRLRYASRDSVFAEATFSDTDSSGVWLDVEHYDAYIPGSGILIWRINDRIISEKRSEGAINNDSYRRGIDLLEADGRQDIGALFGFGDDRAEYSEGHDDDTYRLNGTSTLSPTTDPGSGSIWGGSSGITVKVLDNPGEIMSVSIIFDGNMKGFPLTVSVSGPVTAADLDGDSIDELILSNDDSLYVVNTDGSIALALPSSGHGSIYTDYDNSGKALIVPHDDELLVVQADENTKEYTIGSITLKDRNSSDANPLYAYGNIANIETDTGTWFLIPSKIIVNGEATTDALYTLRLTEKFAGYWQNPELLAELHENTTILSYAASHDKVALLGSDNTIYLITIGDFSITEISFSDLDTLQGPLIADLDRDSNYEIIVTAGKEIIFIQSDGTSERAILSDAPVGMPIAADIDGDGYPEIIQCTEKHLCAFRRDGIPVNGFPFTLPPGESGETITSPPVVVDMNGNGELDIAFATSNMRLISYTPTGDITRGFPVTLKGRVEKTPLVFRRAAPDRIALAYLTTDGLLMALDLNEDINDDMYVWPMHGGGASLASALLNEQIQAEVKTTSKFEYYCYPNPITGGSGRFRITPPEPTDCTITVFTADGRKVFEHYLAESEVIPGVPNEITMNTTDLASGLYIARIKIRNETVLYKLGVLK